MRRIIKCFSSVLVVLTVCLMFSSCEYEFEGSFNISNDTDFSQTGTTVVELVPTEPESTESEAPKSEQFESDECESVDSVETPNDGCSHKNSLRKTGNEKAATYTEEGYIEYKCDICGGLEYRPVEKLECAHKNSLRKTGNEKAATCTEEGYIEYKCTECGELEYRPLKKLAHSPVNNVCSICKGEVID